MSKRRGYNHTPLHTGELPQNPNFDLIDLDVESELPFASIESWVGAREGNYKMMMKILPLVGFYEGLYFNVASKIEKHIHVSTPEDSGRKSVTIHRESDKNWHVSYQDMKKELVNFFRELLGTEWAVSRGLSEIKLIDKHLHDFGISVQRLQKFHDYFSSTSAAFDELLSPDKELACSWPLGCSQNLDRDRAPFASNLQREYEHCKPKTHGETDYALQSMCYMHNMWKGDHVLWDLHTLTQILFR